MTRKQMAFKSFGKRATNTEPNPPKPMQSKKHHVKASTSSINPKKFWSMDFLAERGFKKGVDAAVFTAKVATLGWEKFVKHRSCYVTTVVREFYAGIHEGKYGKEPNYSVVRGTRVPFDARTINDVYELKYSGRAFERKLETAGKQEMEEIKERICEECAVWDRFDAEFKMKKSFLTEEANLWFNFIKHSILPTSHTTTLEKERIVLLDSIINGEDIDVGRIIAREILICKTKGSGNLFFPCLITDLVGAADIDIAKEEERNHPQGSPLTLKLSRGLLL